MDNTLFAALVAVLAAIVAGGAWFGATAAFGWYSNAVIGPLMQRHGWTKRGLWAAHVTAILFVVGLFVPKSDDRDAAERMARGIYGATVIRCYQMSDWELAANESLCRDALRRMKN